MLDSALPEYEHPPVVETILGVQFERLAAFKNAHLGAFWRTLDVEQWPAVADAPMLEPEFERFSDSARWGRAGVELRLSQVPSSRLQIRNADGDRMIQVQNGRLHFNWLGQGGGEYPRYEKVRDGFIASLASFTDYIAAQKLGEFRPNQWEVTYLNHIPKGTLWNSPDDCSFFRLLGVTPTIKTLVQPESFGGGWHFIIPPERGRLHVQWQHARSSKPDVDELVVLTLTARGPLPQETGGDAIFEGLDLGREAIVRSFCEFMSDAANQYWGLRNAAHKTRS